MGNLKHTPEKKFLNIFFDLLNKEKIKYAVLRNWETLPDSLGESDLDLLTDSTNNANRIIHLVKIAAKESGGRITSIYSVEATVLTLGGKNENGEWWGVHIDIFAGLTYFGLTYFSVYDVLEDAVFEKGKFYRCDTLGDVVAFLKECLHNKRTKKNYYPLSISAYNKNPASVINASQTYYWNRGSNYFIKLLGKKFSAEEIKTASKKLIHALYLRNLLSTKFHIFFLLKFKNICKRISRIFKPPGYCVAVLGTDGSGKSTIIEKIRPTLTKMMHTEVEYEHMRPNLIPAIAQLFGRAKSEGPTTDPHAGKVSGIFGSTLRLLYYTQDYIWGFWIKVFPKLIKRPTMFVFDRYFYDYLIDSKRSCIDLPIWFIKFIEFFIPSPDLILCLGTEPEIINARKPELPFHEIVRQVKTLKIFCERHERAVWINTGKSVEESIDQTMEEIITNMANRYE